MVAHRHPLPELLELWRGDLVAQVRLPGEEDLQELRLLRLQVREEADLFESRGAQVLRFVHDQQRPAALGALPDEELAEIAQQQRLRLARRIHAELDQDRFEQLPWLERRVDQTRDHRPVVQPSEDALQQRRLAGADIPRDDDEARAALDAVPDGIQRLPVHAAQIQVFRVRAQRERALT